MILNILLNVINNSTMILWYDIILTLNIILFNNKTWICVWYLGRLCVEHLIKVSVRVIMTWSQQHWPAVDYWSRGNTLLSFRFSHDGVFSIASGKHFYASCFRRPVQCISVGCFAFMEVRDSCVGGVVVLFYFRSVREWVKHACCRA